MKKLILLLGLIGIIMVIGACVESRYRTKQK